jgi:nucleotide-binding universal stress UspA family protein
LLSRSNHLYTKILVGLDGSSDSMKAVDHALAIAKQNEAKVIVVHIIPSQLRTGVYTSSMAIPTSSEYLKRANEAVDVWFERIKQKAGEMDVEVETKLISSGYSAGQIIVDLAEKENVDLIVVGTRGMTGFKKLLLGSVALEVVTYSHCAIIVMK